MRQAIITKFFGPTSRLSPRIKVTCEVESITVPWNYALNPAENHEAAAVALMTKRGWNERNEIIGGALPDGSGYCFVQFSRKEFV